MLHRVRRHLLTSCALCLLLIEFTDTVHVDQCANRRSLTLIDALDVSGDIKRTVHGSGVFFFELLEMSKDELTEVLGLNDTDARRLAIQLKHLSTVHCPDTEHVSRSNAIVTNRVLSNLQFISEEGSGGGQQSCVELVRGWYGNAPWRAPKFLAEDALERRRGHCWGGADEVPKLCLPSAQLVGYSQSGSTALGFLLSKHPQVGDQLGHPATKESNFFRKVGAHRTPVEYDWEEYSLPFLEALRHDDDVLAVDGTPEHVYNDPMTPLLVICHMPWTRIVIILRDPMARLLSMFRGASMISRARKEEQGLSLDHSVCFGESKAECFERQPLEIWLHLGMEGVHRQCRTPAPACGFRSAVDDEWLEWGSEGAKIAYPRSFEAQARHWHMHHDPRHAVVSFFHGLHLSEWLRAFHHSDIHVVFQADLLRDREAVMRELERFLGLDRWGNATFDPYAQLSRPASEQATWIARPEQSPNQRGAVPGRVARAWAQFLADDDAVLRALLAHLWGKTPPWDPLATPDPSLCAKLQSMRMPSPSCTAQGTGTGEQAMA